MRGAIQQARKQSATTLPARAINEAREKKSDGMACVFELLPLMLLLTESTLHFINLKSIFSGDTQSTLEGEIVNWNQVVLSATTPKWQAQAHHTFPCRKPPATPASLWRSFPIDPPTPTEERERMRRFMNGSPTPVSCIIIIASSCHSASLPRC